MAVGVAVAMALTAAVPADYADAGCTVDPRCDDPAPAIDALARGDVKEFFERQPLMGVVSILARAPFRAVAGGTPLDGYRAGLLPCLLAVALLGAVLARIAAERGRPWWFQALVGVGIVYNPVVRAAVTWGHPEELLGGVLLAGAGLAVWRGRAGLAGVLAGLAVGTKLWALAALPALAVGLWPSGLKQFARLAAVVGLVVIAIPAIAAPHQFRSNVESLGRLGAVAGTVTPANIWYPLATRQRFSNAYSVTRDGHVLYRQDTGFVLPRWLARFAHAAVLMAGLLIALAWLRARGGRPAEGALLAVALALLLRCVLDPGSYSYYHAPFILSLVAYEAVVRRSLPVLSLIALAGVQALGPARTHLDIDLFNLAYLAWSLPLAAVMALELYSLRRHGAREALHRTNELSAGASRV